MTNAFRSYITPPEAQQVYDFWLASHAGKPFPAQEDLDLMAIPKLVPSCYIMDVVDKTRFRYRFVGTEIDSHLGKSLTGSMMDEVRKGNLLETLTELFSNTCQKKSPGFATTRMPTEGWSHMLYHRLCLPLSDDGHTISKLFGCHFFERISEAPSRREYVEDASNDEINRVTFVFQKPD